MERDKALILQILRFLRDSDHGATVLPDLADQPRHRVRYHLDLSIEAGLVRRTEPSFSGERVRYLLTWAGHDMLESSCDG